nr:PRC-barrel domain-containing protein [Pseudopedobacter sp.]
MKHRIESLIGFTIGGTDGGIGEVKEFYFDDHTWTIRYLIVETGNWLFGKKVLISPEAVVNPDWEAKVFPVNLTKEQIKNSPDIDTKKTVSRQHEIELYNYYPWTSYWGGGGWASTMGTTGMMTSPIMPLETAIHENIDSEVAAHPHLRSTANVTGYHIKAMDGEIGDVEDFIIDDNTWKIDFMLVDTGNWFPGKKVLISPKWIKEVAWQKDEVIVNASEEQVKNSPEYQPSEHLSETYEANLQNYYGNFIRH